MDKDILVVVMPVHNEEHYIIHALRSLRQQIHKPTRIVVVNDGSTDNTAQISGHYADVITLPRSKGYGPGIARNLNTGKNYLDNSQGFYDFLMVMDADFVLDKKYIVECLNSFDNNTMVVGGLTHGRRITSIRGAHRIYPKWFLDENPFPSIRGWDGYHIYQALKKGYTTKVVNTAIAYEQRQQGRSSLWRELTKGVDSYKNGYTIVHIIVRIFRSLIEKRVDSAMLIPFGYVYACLRKEQKHPFAKNITEFQKQRIKTHIFEFIDKVIPT